MLPPEIRVSLLVSSRNRASLLPPFLSRLDTAVEQEPRAEALLVENGSSDSTAEILQKWAGKHPRRRCFSAPIPGKSRALNAAAVLARGSILAFTDDDVILPPHWLRVVATFFDRRPEFAALTGPIQLPQESGPWHSIPPLRNVWALVLPLVDHGSECTEVRSFYGANYAVRRGVFHEVGGLCELLGPGASGFYDDTDLAWRLRRRNHRIGYHPDAVVYHPPERQRLNRRVLWQRALAFARSERIIEPPPSFASCMLRGLESLGILLWALLTKNEVRHLRARFRLLRHTAHLALMSRLVGTLASHAVFVSPCRYHAFHARPRP